MSTIAICLGAISGWEGAQWIYRQSWTLVWRCLRQGQHRLAWTLLFRKKDIVSAEVVEVSNQESKP